VFLKVVLAFLHDLKFNHKVMKNLYILAAVLFVFSSQAQAATLWSQAPGSSLLFQSSLGTNPHDQYAWDNFKLNFDQFITGIEWSGAYDSSLSNNTQVDSFTVSIWASNFYNDGSPAQPDLNGINTDTNYQGKLATMTIAAADANQISQGNYYNYSYTFTPDEIFAFNSDINKAGDEFTGRDFWIEIYANQTGTPNWSLWSGIGGDNYLFRQAYLGNGDMNWDHPSADSAFTLNTIDAVPLPASIWLFLSAVSGILLISKKSKQ